jgi:hypothetical protein
MISRTGKYKILTLIGMTVALIGLGSFCFTTSATSTVVLAIKMLVAGIGMGIVTPIFTIVAQSAFPSTKLGEVTGATQLFTNIGSTVGVAALGGVMNNGLVVKLPEVAQSPFITLLKSSGINNLPSLNINTLQQSISAEGVKQLNALIAQAPVDLQAQLTVASQQYLQTAQNAFIYAFDHIFVACTIIMALALVVAFFLPEIVLRKTNDGESL